MAVLLLLLADLEPTLAAALVRQLQDSVRQGAADDISYHAFRR